MNQCPLTPGSLDRLVQLGELSIRGVVWLGIFTTSLAVVTSGLVCLAWKRGISAQLGANRAEDGRMSEDDDKELDLD